MLLIILILSVITTADLCNPQLDCGCSTYSPRRAPNIVGGFRVPDRRWGWMVSLQYFGRHRCGASLLNSEYAITVAHCVEDVSPNHLEILAGTNRLNDDSTVLPQRRTITEIYIHPDYNSALFTYDIAIIRFLPLNTGINSTLSFICLPKKNQDPFIVGTNLIAIGWGVLQYGAYAPSNTLRQVTVKAMASKSFECKQVQIENTKVQFCAGLKQGGKDTCQGDSGGPYMAFVDNRWILAGLTSSGMGCALAGYPGLCTRVSSFIPYIKSIINASVTTTTSTAIKSTLTTKSSTKRTTSRRTTKTTI